MSLQFARGLLLTVVLSQPCAGAETVARWWGKYQGQEAKGEHVLGYWRFDTAEGLLRDESSHQHRASLRGAVWSTKGRFGGALESSAGYPVPTSPVPGSRIRTCSARSQHRTSRRDSISAAPRLGPRNPQNPGERGILWIPRVISLI